MANKKAKYGFRGATQDVTKSKHPFEYYFEAQHIRIVATDSQSTGSAINEKGNASVITIPSVTITTSTNTISYGTSTLSYTDNGEIDTQITAGLLPTSSSTQVIIGHTETRSGLIIFTTDDLGMDCIWVVRNLLDNDYTIELLYVRNLGFSTSNPIEAIYNYENEDIQKTYWVDGVHQLRYININYNNIEGNAALIDVPSNTINLVGNISFSQPIITQIISGGSHTAGRIQYAYNLYRLNGSQTTISPLSEMVSLDKGTNLGGGDLNEVVGATPVIQINGIDQAYTNIKVYAIKYTSYNEDPSVNLIDERDLNGATSITIYDDGGTISSLTLEEFVFLGSRPTSPQHIETKYNRLFLANLQDEAFDIPDELDCRAYAFPINSTTTRVFDAVTEANVNNPNTGGLVVNSNYLVPEKHDAVNVALNTRKYQYNSSVLGGEGKYIQYQIVQRTAAQLNNVPGEYTLLKDNEIYRIGIEFYNNLGQISPPQWIADFRTPEGNLAGNYNTLKVTLKASFYTWLAGYSFESDSARPVGYRIIRADRTVTDRTILCQGSLTGMMCQTTNDKANYSYWEVESNRRTESNSLIKFPIPVSRGFLSNINPLNKTFHLKMMNEQTDYGSDTGEFPNEEIYSGTASSTKRQQSWQFTKLFQLNSPDILFDTGIGFSAGLKFKIRGMVKNTKNDIWYKRIQTANKSEKLAAKVESVSSFMTNTDIKFLALFGPSDRDDEMDFTLINREYNTYIDSTNNTYFDIYGAPEVTERGQGVVAYNGDSTLKYKNTFEGFLTDESDDIPDESAIVSMNSYGNRCLTFAEGLSGIPLTSRKALETIHASLALGESDGLMLAEVVLPELTIYTGNIYGGNSYEDKSRTTYLKIGSYTDINTTSVQIDNAGDTYVANYRFARVSKTDTEVLDDQTLQLTEVMSFPVETAVDLKNRNDKSLFDWDTEFQPLYNDYHNYNRVYSQQPNLVETTSVDFNFRRIKDYDTRIQATNEKIPNEVVDSWTDVLENEIMDLDGRYGAINGIITFKDEMFAFQDEAIAKISINPRIQVQGSDGVGIELGIGGILYDHSYISTKSGSINKWSIVKTKRGLYYYDALNKAVGRVPDHVDMLLTDAKGMHTFFNNHYNYTDIKQNNPILGTGAVFGYDSYNNDVYFTVLQTGDSFTWVFNELRDEFVDLKTYTPSRYMSKGDKLILPNSANKVLYEQYKGEYNNFFGVYQPSYITLQLNPEPDKDCVFDTIQFNSEMYLNGVDQPNNTLTHIQAYNDYQDSGEVALVLGRDKNLRRKFREWKANIPRENRNRIRNPWIFLKLKLENTSNYKLILHDPIINYTVSS